MIIGLINMSKQIVMISLEDLVPVNHIYRKFLNIWKLGIVQNQLKDVEKDNNYKGYGTLRLLNVYYYNFLKIWATENWNVTYKNTVSKWFCGFGLTEITPNYTVFGRIRQRIGTSRLSKIFGELRDQLKAQGYINEVFSFIDASQLISKASLWQERDKVIKEKYEKLNNETLPKVAFDKEARIGCKGKDKYWYGYKKHVCVDMQSGLINKVAVTPGNVTDSKGLENVCPDQGAIYTDKAYCT